MNIRWRSLKILLGIITGLGLGLAPALAAEGPHALGAGMRYHAEHSVFSELPYGNGDLSYALAYQYAQGFAIWQLACDLGPDVSGKRLITSGTTTNQVDVDYIITPQFNLIIRDGCLLAGAGIRTSYIRDMNDEGEWLDPYWQLQLGISLPIHKRMSLDINAYYVYEHWNKLPNFKFGDLEYGAWLNFTF